MKRTSQILMRLLNVITAASFLWIALRIALFFASVAVWRDWNWTMYILYTIIPALLAMLGVGVVSYIFFGKFRVWHRSRGRSENDDLTEA